MDKLDYIIVGQGITGTCLAVMLMERGKKIKIIDNRHAYSSTKIAAGIINPVTGRKYVKSWMMDTLLPFAKEFYMNIELQLGMQLMFETEIKRNMPSIAAVNEWMARCQDVHYDDYVGEVTPDKILSNYVYSDHGFSKIKNVLRIDIALMIQKFRSIFLDLDILIEDEFDHIDLEHKDGVLYQGVKAEKIIFCEGYRSIYNPYFRNLPFIPLKGEVVELKIPDLNLDCILRHDRFLVPMGNDIYWTGGGYEREIINEEPTEAYMLELKKDLDRFLKCDYEILSHRAAVRPAVKDRKPILGEHSEYKNIFICNGMGTKGASLAPYFCNHLIDHLENGSEILAEVHIDRFRNVGHSE